MNKTKQKINVTLQPLAGGSFSNWIKLLVSNGGIDRKYILRAIFVSFVSCLGIPIRMIEKAIFDKKIANLEINYPPIFIIGHWRSGTTYLHNLMIQDPDLGYISTTQSWGAEMFLISQKILEPILNKFFPSKRPMDNIALSAYVPQEEEFAIANMSTYSFYHGWYFPKNIKKYFRDFVLFEGVSEEIKTEWKNIYLKIFKKVSFSTQGKRIVMKNPPNTARIKLLLEIFPDAKFIHIYRNPYMVYLSTKNLYEKLVPEFILQNIDEQEIEANILEFYQDLMQKFFSEKHLIPENNLIEIKYENLISNEITEIQRIYEQLNLPNFEKSLENFQKYIDSQSNYQQNEYSLDGETIKKVYNSWKFTIEKWQYNPPHTNSKETENQD